jgi:hypothetical protein
MTWLLFMDESGHDHRHLPFEVRGGIALHVGQLWPFIEAWRRLEEHCFGVALRAFGKEAKGAKLLDRDRLRWSGQESPLPDAERQKLARSFLEYGAARLAPTRRMFSAYGQASLALARGVFDLLKDKGARLFASMVRRGSSRALATQPDGQTLRADHAVLFNRFHDFLSEQACHGLIVMDETDRALDRRFLTTIETQYRAVGLKDGGQAWLVPSPLFVSSELSLGVQAADVCLYCMNWGYRRAEWRIEAAGRADIAELFAPALQAMEWRGVDRRGVNLITSDHDSQEGST